MTMKQAVVLIFFGLFLIGVDVVRAQKSVKTFASLSEKLTTNVSYTAIQDACKSQLESWAEMSSAPNNLSDTSRPTAYSFVVGTWHRSESQARSDETPVVEGETGIFDFVSFDDLDRSTYVHNVTGSIYLGRQARMSRDTSGSYVNVAVAGVHDSVTGEICMVGCLDKHSFHVDQPGSYQNSNESSDCEVRVLLTLTYPRIKLLKTSVKGTIESLRQINDTRFFPTLQVEASMQSVKDQHALYMAALAVRFTTILVEVILVIIQIFYSAKSEEAYYISTLGLCAQVGILGFRWVIALYLPLTFFRKAVNYKFLLKSWRWMTPLISDFCLICGYVVLVAMVARRRKSGEKKKGEKKVTEKSIWAIGLPLYLTIGFGLWWWRKGLQTYLQIVLFWWLLPQIIASAAWDVRGRTLLPIFIVGVSLCRFSMLSFDTFRPVIYGYDEIFNFPRSLYWPFSVSLLVLVAIAWSQQAYGGRWLIPKRLYGYHQIELSTTSISNKIESIDQEV